MAPNVDETVNKQTADIQLAYQRLALDLGTGNLVTSDIFGQTRQDVTGAYDQGLNDLNSIVNSLESRLGRAASVVGQNPATDLLRANLAQQSARMEGQQTALDAALAAQGGAYQAVGQRAIGDTQREGTRFSLEAANRLRTSLYEYLGMEEKARGDVELQRLANQASLEELNAQIAAQQMEGQLALRRLQMEAAERAADRAAASQPSLMDELNAQLKGLEIEEKMRELYGDQPPSDIEDYGSGQAALEFLRSASPTERISKSDLSLVNNILNEAFGISGERSQQGVGETDPWQIARQLLSQQQLQYGSPSMRATAIDSFFGKNRAGAYSG